nr:polysaccharide biosynthesis tyrosine autokinase [uncultured Actinoplanes sp.]
MSVRDFLRLLRRNVIVMVVCLVAGVALGGFAALHQPSYYTTHTRLFVSSNGSDSTDTLLQNSNLVLDRVPSYASMVNSPLVLSQVAQRLGRTEPVQSMAGRITATNPLQTALIDITVRDTTARRAYELAAAVSAAVMSVVPRLETAATGFVPIKITLVSQPEMPARADLGPAASRLALGILLGLLLGTVIVVGGELLNARLEDPEQLRTKLNLAPLGVLAGGRRGDRAAPPDDAYWASRAGEGYRQLRANLRALVASDGLRSILVTGPHDDDGAATVAQNLAIALSRVRLRVLLIEADLRHPRFAAALGIGDTTAGRAGGEAGLAAVLAGDRDVDMAIYSWGDGALRVLPAGTAAGASGELLASGAMRDLLARLEQRFDLLIISAPPMLEVADAAVLAAGVDGVVLTSRIGGTRWTAVRQSLQALHDAGARVLGAAVLGKTRGAGRASPDALTTPVAAPQWPAPGRPVAAARANGTPRRFTKPGGPTGAGPVPEQLTAARGVAAVGKTVEAPAHHRTTNNRTEQPNDTGRWA